MLIFEIPQHPRLHVGCGEGRRGESEDPRGSCELSGHLIPRCDRDACASLPPPSPLFSPPPAGGASALLRSDQASFWFRLSTPARFASRALHSPHPPGTERLGRSPKAAIVVRRERERESTRLSSRTRETARDHVPFVANFVSLFHEHDSRRAALLGGSPDDRTSK